MKNLFYFFIALILIISLVSCSKDESSFESLPGEKIEQNGGDLSGENSPLLDESQVNKELSMIQKNKSVSKDIELKNGAFNRSNKDESKSRSITNIFCYEKKYGTTIHETNTVDNYPGADKVYRLYLDYDSDIVISLTNLSTDLDLFLYRIVKDGYGRELIGERIDQSYNGGSYNETIETSLNAGEYFIIIETWGSEGDFALQVDCDRINTPNPPQVWCEDYQNMVASYSYGISAQSYLWNKFTSSARDGLVLHETAHSSNKVVKFDAKRFGYQDAVRDILGLPISQGAYQVAFKLWIGEDSRCDLIIEKNSDYGTEQGFYAYVKNNRLNIKYRNITYTLNTYVPENQWIPINLYFDLNNEYVALSVNNTITVLMDTRAAHNRDNLGSNKVYGMDFFTQTYSSKFHIDDICVTEWEPGYDDPTRIQSILYGEIKDLR